MTFNACLIIDPMRIDDMTLLVRVSETGSMTRAARQLHLTPAAVSATIRRIEAALGVRLFERTTRALHPTDEGQIVIEGCQRVVDGWQRTLEEARASRHELVGTVHLSAPADTSHQVVAPVVVELCEAHPRLQVVVHASDTVQHLHRDAIDMAIRYGSLKDSALTARKLAEQPGVLVAAPAYLERHGAPQHPDALSEHRCITLQLAGAAFTAWTLQRDGRSHTAALRRPLCGDGHLARRWAIAGVGIAFKSLFDVIDDLEAGRLVRVLPGWSAGPSAIHAVFPSGRHQPARVRALDDALTAACAARAARCDAWLAARP